MTTVMKFILIEFLTLMPQSNILKDRSLRNRWGSNMEIPIHMFFFYNGIEVWTFFKRPRKVFFYCRFLKMGIHIGKLCKKYESFSERQSKLQGIPRWFEHRTFRQEIPGGIFIWVSGMGNGCKSLSEDFHKGT